MKKETATEEIRMADLPDYDGLFEKNRREKNVSLRILYSFFMEHKKHFLIAQFYFLLKNAPVWVLPLISAEVINLATNPNESSVWDFVIMGLAALVLVLQNVWSHVRYAMHNNRALRHISAGIRNSLIRKLQQLSITYHKDIETGRLQSKFLRDVEAVEGLNRQVFENVITTVISIIITIIITLTKSWVIMLFYLVVIPINLLLINAFRRRMRRENCQYRTENEQLSARITDMLTMIPVTKAHGLENTEIDRLSNNIRHVASSGLQMDETVAKFGSWNWVVGTLLSTSCLIFTGVLAYFGYIEVGDIVLYQSYFSAISGQAQMLINIFPMLNTGMESLRSLSEIMLSDEIEDNRDKIRLRYVHGSVQFENVSYHYPNTRQDVVSHLNLDVNPGQCVAFVGASGSGKTTIMNMIIGFLQATDGVVKIDGKPIGALHLQDYRHFLSVVPQNSILFTGTIRQNILYGLADVPEEKLMEIVDRANIREFIERLPDGLDTLIGEHGDKLSGGQKQRISIARALIRDPRIIILDEATSALDNISEYEVQKAMNELMKGRTTFIVAHRLSTIRNADLIVVMKDGVCIEQGSYEELMELHGEFYQLQKLSERNTEITLGGEKMKRVLALVVSVLLLVSILTGCMGAVGEVKLNEDATGTIKVSVGYTKEGLELLASMNGSEEPIDTTDMTSFTYNGFTYYGKIESMDFSNLEELNAVMNKDTSDTEFSSESETTYRMEQEKDGYLLFTITAKVTPEEETEEVQDAETQATIDELYKQMTEVYEVTFPSAVKQTQGPKKGITIKGKTLVVDFIELRKDVTEVTCVFSTAEDTVNINAVTFEDVKEPSWYYDAVMALAEGGLVAGMGNNLFAPDNALTYAQFCQILARAKGLPTGAGNDYWAYHAIESCLDAGYILDRGPIIAETFDEEITREAAVSAMYLAKKEALTTNETIKASDIPDFESVTTVYRENVLAAYNSGITTGMDEQKTFMPQGTLTRAQVCQLFYNLDWTYAD